MGVKSYSFFYIWEWGWAEYIFSSHSIIIFPHSAETQLTMPLLRALVAPAMAVANVSAGLVMPGCMTFCSFMCAMNPAVPFDLPCCAACLRALS